MIPEKSTWEHVVQVPGMDVGYIVARDKFVFLVEMTGGWWSRRKIKKSLREFAYLNSHWTIREYTTEKPFLFKLTMETVYLTPKIERLLSRCLVPENEQSPFKEAHRRACYNYWHAQYAPVPSGQLMAAYGLAINRDKQNS